MNKSTFALLTTCILVLTSHISHAGSATWTQTPVDNDWSNANNWMPNTVPNSTTDAATFGTSDTTAISIHDSIDLASVTFQPGASAYTLTVTNAKTLELFGSPNIINNSGVEQNFVADGALMVIHGTETLDSTVHFDVLNYHE